MNRVKRLPPEVAERIAAGEVVDRPSSIVKELLENSLDAEAGFIEVDIEEGGRQLIRITDDGLGMSPQDARLAVERHATSKLRSWEDLEQLHSFGFRGEALPSIAAVSRFELVTTERGETVGTRVSMEGPLSVNSEPAAGPVGTRVDVRDLFWNTPARRKFLKSPTGEAMKITELVTRFAILNPKVGFRLSLNSKEKLFIPAHATLAERLADYWKLETSQLMEVEEQMGDILVEGVIAKPSHHRRNRAAQLLAVNGRIITSQSLSQAFVEGFDPLVPRGRHPYCFINLQVDPSSVDVNIHPTKAEVRFADSRAPFRAIYKSIRNCLDREKVETVKETQWESTLDSGSKPKEFQENFAQSIPPVLVGGKDYRSSKPAPPSFAPPGRAPETQRVMEMYRPPESKAAEQSNQSEVEQGEFSEVLSPCEQPQVLYLSRLYGAYLVAKVDDQLWVIDQHAAHERISYEKLHRFQVTGPDSQGLIVPFHLKLNAQEKVYLEEHRARFEEIGFNFEWNEEEVFLRAVPPGIKNHKVASFFEELLADMCHQAPSESGTPVAQYREKLRAMMACKSSIRAREKISAEEAVRLIEDLITAERSPFCPHGRPTRIRLDEKTLERLFHRS